LAGAKVGTLEASPHDGEGAYVAVDRHRLDDFRPYIYRTHDGGASWRLVVEGIAPTHTVNVVREDPVRPGLLFAGTERGVYVSFDDGDRWQPLQLGLPVTSVRDIEIKGIDLIVATHGRGFWILDDISPLRQLPLATAPAPAHLFAPAPAIRIRPEGFTGTPFPPEEPKAENPRFGAYLDYYLATGSSSPVVLTVRDAAGELVRRYSSDDRPAPIDPARLRSTPEWVSVPSTLETGAGMHRFVWSLRYPATPAVAKGDPFEDGVWAPPGRYRVELEVGGVRYEQPLEVVPDPRVDLPAEAYAAQFELAREISVEIDRVAAARSALGSLQRALTRARREAPPRVAPLLGAFQEEVTEVSGVVPSDNPGNSWWLPARSLTSLRALASALSSLESAVDDADAAPSPDARSGFAALRPRIEAGLAAWESLRTERLSRLNRALRRHGVPELSAGG